MEIEPELGSIEANWIKCLGNFKLGTEKTVTFFLEMKYAICRFLKKSKLSFCTNLAQAFKTLLSFSASVQEVKLRILAASDTCTTAGMNART